MPICSKINITSKEILDSIKYYRELRYTDYLNELIKLEEFVIDNLKIKKKGLFSINLFSSNKEIEYEGADASLSQESIDNLILFLLDFYSKNCVIDLDDEIIERNEVIDGDEVIDNDEIIDSDVQIIKQSTEENPYIILMNKFKKIHLNFFKILFRLQKLKIIEGVDDGFQVIDLNCDENFKKITTHPCVNELLVLIGNICEVAPKQEILEAALYFDETDIRILNQKVKDGATSTQWLNDLNEKLNHLKTEKTEISHEVGSHTTISKILAINAEFSSSPTVKKQSKKNIAFKKNEVKKINTANTSNTNTLRNLFKNKKPSNVIVFQESPGVKDKTSFSPSFSRNNGGG